MLLASVVNARREKERRSRRAAARTPHYITICYVFGMEEHIIEVCVAIAWRKDLQQASIKYKRAVVVAVDARPNRYVSSI